MSKNLEKKLLDAYYDQDLKKMEKYLEKGVSPRCYEDGLFTMASGSGEIEILKLLIKFDKGNAVKSNEQIIAIADVCGHEDCFRLLAEYVDPEDFKYSVTYKHIIEVVGNNLEVH